MVSGRETSVPGLHQLKREQDQKASAGVQRDASVTEASRVHRQPGLRAASSRHPFPQAFALQPLSIYLDGAA